MKEEIKAEIKKFLIHHLEHPEAVAGAIYNAKLARGGCGQLPWEQTLIHFPDNAERFIDDAKAALQCLLEDL